MELKNGLHLAYCTNIHRGETWAQVLETLNKYTLAVRGRVSQGKPYAIGLRLGQQAAHELSAAQTLKDFRHWLDRNNCYIFTINGFPYGSFHGTRVKEQVYLPDWTSPERLEYTNRLFDLLASLVPPNVEGSVSTVPCSYKEFITSEQQVQQMVANVWRCVDHIEKLQERTGRVMHLGLEPEPLCYLETSSEAVAFFDRLRAHRPNDDKLNRNLGVNYDTCHLAVEFEQAKAALENLQRNAIKISKLHFSSALKVRPTPEARRVLNTFLDTVYFHQVVASMQDGTLRRYRDLDNALAIPESEANAAREWRIHFHIPLHSPPGNHFESTSDHILDVMDYLAAHPGLCRHIEMETYTWEVLPEGLKNRDVVNQLVGEYAWTLQHLAERGLADAAQVPPHVAA